MSYLLSERWVKVLKTTEWSPIRHRCQIGRHKRIWSVSANNILLDILQDDFIQIYLLTSFLQYLGAELCLGKVRHILDMSGGVLPLTDDQNCLTHLLLFCVSKVTPVIIAQYPVDSFRKWPWYMNSSFVGFSHYFQEVAWWIVR